MVRDARQLRVQEIDTDSWQQDRVVSPLPGAIALGELLELASCGRLHPEPGRDRSGHRVVRLEVRADAARYFLVSRSALPLLGLRPDLGDF